MDTVAGALDYSGVLKIAVGCALALLYIFVRLREKEKTAKDEAKISAVKDTVDRALEDLSGFQDSIRDTMAEDKKEVVAKVDKLSERMTKFREDTLTRYATKEELEKTFGALQEDLKELKGQVSDVDSISREQGKMLVGIESSISNIAGAISEIRHGRRKG